MLKKTHVLVVDDEPTIVKMLVCRLASAGYEVETAADGVEALEKAAASLPDLVILDVMMPKMNGFDVCRKMKESDVYKNIPVIMLTARSQEKDEKTGLSCGASAYIKKPFRSEELLEKMQELIHERETLKNSIGR